MTIAVAIVFALVCIQISLDRLIKVNVDILRTLKAREHEPTASSAPPPT